MNKKKDLKEALSGGRKADITHIRTPLLTYGARACEYGSEKYERANFLRETPGLKQDFERLRGYLRAALSHINTTLDSMEYHQANDPDLEDLEGMRAAAYCEDVDVKPNQPVVASRLPHLCGAVASLNMAITQATRCGLLPLDPGRPWETPEAPSTTPYRESIDAFASKLAGPEIRLAQSKSECESLEAFASKLTGTTPEWVSIEKDARGVPNVTITLPAIIEALPTDKETDDD